jgi:hypothetical protein
MHAGAPVVGSTSTVDRIDSARALLAGKQIDREQLRFPARFRIFKGSEPGFARGLPLSGRAPKAEPLN